ncbi:unnamed protein product [Vitrella brassicaformis CCMP3155]|uniref:Uncharacterized protein n=1 Tax=Vitrella brassicaformis (strain CCMP3155) TaxID=1169540 RepID=A0A0G4GMK2_VITBC|nr:unnamed protein product [Vitrella brassicaformis CCMP3155]|eukprot:CEM31424.1 unnamed protein product [Vitrella brassicaformis CCMP3155]
MGQSCSRPKDLSAQPPHRPLVEDGDTSHAKTFVPTQMAGMYYHAHQHTVEVMTTTEELHAAAQTGDHQQLARGDLAAIDETEGPALQRSVSFSDQHSIKVTPNTYCVEARGGETAPAKLFGHQDTTSTDSVFSLGGPTRMMSRPERSPEKLFLLSPGISSKATPQFGNPIARKPRRATTESGILSILNGEVQSAPLHTVLDPSLTDSSPSLGDSPSGAPHPHPPSPNPLPPLATPSPSSNGETGATHYHSLDDPLMGLGGAASDIDSTDDPHYEVHYHRKVMARRNKEGQASDGGAEGGQLVVNGPKEREEYLKRFWNLTGIDLRDIVASERDGNPARSTRPSSCPSDNRAIAEREARERERANAPLLETPIPSAANSKRVAVGGSSSSRVAATSEAEWQLNPFRCCTHMRRPPNTSDALLLMDPGELRVPPPPLPAPVHPLHELASSLADKGETASQVSNGTSNSENNEHHTSGGAEEEGAMAGIRRRAAA